MMVLIWHFILVSVILVYCWVSLFNGDRLYFRATFDYWIIFYWIEYDGGIIDGIVGNKLYHRMKDWISNKIMDNVMRDKLYHWIGVIMFG